tara:strand:+ start:146 stop:466 length:321 start_codon:yes stop_codon:yes gene_type:complete
MPPTKFYLLPYTRCADNSIESSLGLSTPEKMYGVIERDDQVISLHHLTIRNMLQFAEQAMEGGRYFERCHYDYFRPMKDYYLHGHKLMVDNVDEELARIRPIIGQV